MRGVGVGDVEGGFHCRLGRGRETPTERNVKDKLKIKINRVEG
jgi:hypothetical protein